MSTISSKTRKQARRDAERLRKDVLDLADKVRDKVAADERREQLMERAAATAGLVLPLLPALARRAARSRKARHVAMRAPVVVATRTNPVLLAVSLASAGYLGWRLWKRRAAASEEADREQVRSERAQIARMDDEGAAQLPAEPAVLHAAGNGSR